MRINEVEKELNLSKKSIRFYEENNLLKPKRNKDNLYRDYTFEDIEKLKKIKFLRTLNVSINELKKLDKKEITLKDLLIKKENFMEIEKQKLEKIKRLYDDIILNNYSYFNLDINKYFETLKILEEEKIMQGVKINQSKKIKGAILATISFNLLFCFMIFLITYFEITNQANWPIGFYIFMIVMLLLPQVGTIINLRSRIKEIKEGEEDDALKY